MHGETNRIHAPEAEILPVVKAHVARLPRRLNPQEFPRSVRDRSGLLTGHGVDEYGFQHLSFQEYLTAEEIRNTRAFESLAQRSAEGRRRLSRKPASISKAAWRSCASTRSIAPSWC